MARNIPNNVEFQILSQEKREKIHEASLKLLETTGVRVTGEPAIELLKANGIEVYGETRICELMNRLKEENTK